MTEKYTSHFIQTNGIKLHYLDFEKDDAPTLILMHGLTANCHAFDGLIAAGLTDVFRVISVDLRGRGLSDHPEEGYTIPEHAKDILGLLDHLKIDEALIGGHSYGGLLSIYLAANFPYRIAKIFLLDAAARMHHNTAKMLIPAMSRLGQTFPSFESYLEKIKNAPYMKFWDEAMVSYYKADVFEHADGSVTPRSAPKHIFEAVNNVLSEPWQEHIERQKRPAILINAPEIYTLRAPLLPKGNALATVQLMPDCKYVRVDGNHQTMLYGKGARQIVSALYDFVYEENAVLKV